MSQELSLEQEFELQAFDQRIQELSEAESKELLGDLYKHNMVQANVFRALLKDAWGIDQDLKQALEAR
ncbi:MAG: NblA-related protein [Oscillatoriales cyanobacterium RM1_1_9]|nr:NblA-related protein [Oscillatoriales cyanobacterium RM2_1_1]NJO71273.1 NblA-related protein [Oscillatoriales cyanobacterium RM1_1_9]